MFPKGTQTRNISRTKKDEIAFVQEPACLVLSSSLHNSKVALSKIQNVIGTGNCTQVAKKSINTRKAEVKVSCIQGSVWLSK